MVRPELLGAKEKVFLHIRRQLKIIDALVIAPAFDNILGIFHKYIIEKEGNKKRRSCL